MNIDRRYTTLMLLAAPIAIAGCDDVVGDEVSWPPRLGQPFPDVEFISSDGDDLRMSQFKGKVVLMEPVGMTCEACNAFSGGNKVGGFDRILPQGNLSSLEEYIEEYSGGVTLAHPDLVLIQVLLYDLAMEAPDFNDVKAWAEHFRFDENPNIFVVAPKSDLRGNASWHMIPGVQLIDKDSVVRYDSTGHRRRHNLWTELLPAVSRYVKG